MKKILSLDNLYEFYLKQNKTCNFNAYETGYQIAVQVPASFEINKNLQDDSLMFCKVKLMHSGENRNHSSVTDDALVKASKTLAYKPILANFIEYVDEETGETLKDFTSHDMKMNEDGTIEYIEKQIGCFTSDKPYFEIEEETGHNFLYGYCAIPKDYTDACEIIERKNGTKISVELAVNEMAYDAKSKVLELTDVIIMGATCLGKNPDTLEDVGEGMLNARLDIEDFSMSNNSLIQYAEKLELLTSKVDTLLSRFDTKENLEEGGTDVENEIILNEEVTTEEETVETAEATEDVVEKPVVETESVEEVTEETTTEETVTTEEEFSEEPTEETPAVEESETEEVFENNSESEVIENELKYSISYKDLIKEFSLSMNEKIEAISNLVNDTYSETDNTWYSVICYDETKEVIMVDYWTGRAFKQSYKVKSNTYSLTGDRVEVYATYLTADEQKQLDQLKSNYSLATDKLVELEEKLNKYETEPQKEELLNSDKFNLIKEAPEFVELKKQENHFDLSVEEVETKAKDILLSYAMNGKLEFSAKEDSTQTMVFMGAEEVENEKKPYGGIFEAFYKNKKK